jgi:hypothetical protein
MCGPSGAEKGIQNDQWQLSKDLTADFQTRFGSQSSLLDYLNKNLTSITSKGPSQQGFSGGELSALQTQAINNAGAANTAAQQAARTYGAGQGGGGTSGLTSGITKQIQSAIASQQAGNLGTNLNNINLADWQTGSKNYWSAMGAQQALANQFDPTAFSGQAQSGLGSSFQMADTIQKEESQKQQAIASGIMGAAMDIALPGIGGAMGMGGAAGGFGGLIQGITNPGSLAG